MAVFSETVQVNLLYTAEHQTAHKVTNKLVNLIEHLTSWVRYFLQEFVETTTELWIINELCTYIRWTQI